MAAHRYWRLYIPKVAQSGSYVAVSELEMFAVSGGSNVAVGGTASASSQFSGTYAASKAFDGSTASDNGWQSAGISSVDWVWLAYDLGAGNDQDIVEIAIKSTASSGSQINNTNQFPRQFLFQWSDNGTDWTTQRGIADLSWSFAETKTIDVTELSSGQIVNRVVTDKTTHKIVQAPNTGEPVASAQKFVGMTAAIRSFGFSRPLMSAPHNGDFKITGSTTSLGNPIARRVDLIDQKSGQIIRRINTQKDGQFEFLDIAEGPWTVMGVDNSAEQNSVVFSHVTATPQ